MDALELHYFGPMRCACRRPEKTFIRLARRKTQLERRLPQRRHRCRAHLASSRQERVALFAAAAEKWVPNYLDSFSDSGYDNEGIGYWVYGFSNYTELREQLWLSTGGKIDLFDNPKARKAALFGFQFAMLPGVYADFGDAHFMYKPDQTFLARVDRIFRSHQFPDDLAIMRGAHEKLSPPPCSPPSPTAPNATIPARRCGQPSRFAPVVLRKRHSRGQASSRW